MSQPEQIPLHRLRKDEQSVQFDRIAVACVRMFGSEAVRKALQEMRRRQAECLAEIDPEAIRQVLRGFSAPKPPSLRYGDRLYAPRCKFSSL